MEKLTNFYGIYDLFIFTTIDNRYGLVYIYFGQLYEYI